MDEDKDEAINRTILELKPNTPTPFSCIRRAINRTILELKPGMFESSAHFARGY